jgi:hypothetical protein
MKTGPLRRTEKVRLNDQGGFKDTVCGLTLPVPPSYETQLRMLKIARRLNPSAMFRSQYEVARENLSHDCRNL